MDQSKIIALQKLQEQQEPSYLKRIRQKADELAGKYIVDPLAERGYGDLGAAIATVPSTVVDAALPQPREAGEPLAGNLPLVDRTKKMMDIVRTAEQKYGTSSAQYEKVVDAYRRADGDYGLFEKFLRSDKPTPAKVPTEADIKRAESMKNAKTINYGKFKTDRENELIEAERNANVYNKDDATLKDSKGKPVK